MTDTLKVPGTGRTGAPSEASWKLGLSISKRERWYVANTLSRRELGAKQQLEQQGFRTFAPYIIRTVRHARKLRSARAPVFPGYVFVILDLHRDRWRSVNGTLGIARLIMAGEQPQPVPRGVVEDLVARTDDRGLLGRQQEFRVGDAVRVIAGPFSNVLGRLDRLDDNGRVRVLLDIMGGRVPALLASEAIEALAG
jgi:transcriptional antiterminator RfaH